MNNKHFIQSELKIIASENIDVSQDLKSEQLHSIGELLDNEKTKKNNQEKENQPKEE